jgi:hypothetical protein
VSAPAEAMMVIPDFTGKNVSECLSSASESGLNIRIAGDCLGVAVSQDPGPTFGQNTVTAATTTGTTGTSTSTEGTMEVVTHLKRGSIVTISFAAIEEEIAQSGETE